MLTYESYTNAGIVYNLLVTSRIYRVLSIFNFIKNTIKCITEIEQNLVNENINNFKYFEGKNCNDFFANINLVGYKNYLYIDEETEEISKELSNEFNLLSKIYSNEIFARDQIIEGFKLYNQKMTNHMEKLAIKRHRSPYKKYDIDDIKGILKNGIKRFIEINNNILDGYKIEYNDNNNDYNGLNYKLLFTKKI